MPAKLPQVQRLLVPWGVAPETHLPSRANWTKHTKSARRLEPCYHLTIVRARARTHSRACAHMLLAFAPARLRGRSYGN
eukprot:4970429-Lingulodinium_polyedra.AAC.1